jgi:plastocyanin
MSRLERAIPVRAGDTVRLRVIYDNSFPHVRVMGIMPAYFAPGAVDCTHPLSPQPVDLKAPPRWKIRLLKAPSGSVQQNLRSTWVGDFMFGAQRVSIRRGTTFTWRFVGRDDHDATVATGPVGFASTSTRTGTYRFRFARKGTYRLYCSLHPSRMTEVITVR